MLRYSMTLIGENDLYLDVADVNFDGAYNTLDALVILRSYMGLL